MGDAQLWLCWHRTSPIAGGPPKEQRWLRLDLTEHSPGVFDPEGEGDCI